MSASRKTVMWVDDEIEFLRAHILFLETRGYSVIPVFSGDDALHLLREKPKEFDLVLLDEQMPGKDGLTTLSEIKEMLPDLPVVMVTKSEEEKVMDDALGKKIDGYLTKPVNPSQILSICKRILDSAQIISTQLAQKYSREYTLIRQALSTVSDYKGFIRLYDSLTRWDFELDSSHDEGLRQAHAAQKSDCEIKFAEFISESYGMWMKGVGNPPLMSHGVLDKFVRPPIEHNKPVVLVVLDCMRLDHYYAIESFLRQEFMVQRSHYFSIVPSSTTFARASLFSGKLPINIATDHPDFFPDKVGNVPDCRSMHKTLLFEKLKTYNVSGEDEFFYLDLSANADVPETLSTGELLAGKKGGAIIVDFINHLTSTDTDLAIVREMAPDEHAFRSLTRSWFEHSTLRQILKSLASQECTIIFTTDHGCTHCSRTTEIYGTKTLSKNLRFTFGDSITCDDRHALQISDPGLYGLSSAAGSSFIVALENYYFSIPDKFENFSRNYKSSFQHGGISMGEMILPISVLEPR